MKRGPTRAYDAGTRPSAYATALRQLIEHQQWLSRELIKKYPDVHRIYEVRELRDQAERRLRWIERHSRR